MQHLMAESSPTPPKVDSLRSGVIDTAPPFESVKAAVSLFGEKADFGDGKGWKHPSSAEVGNRHDMCRCLPACRTPHLFVVFEGH